MIKRAIIGLACLAFLPGQAAASAAVIAAAAGGAASAAAGAAASRNSSSAQQLPQGISGAPIEWDEVGWLTCPRRLTEPQGCGDDTNWKGETLDVEPWIVWMKRHKGERARFMGMTVIEGGARLFYGVPVEGVE
ncbi:MAG: hypothetical protein ABGX76_04315 [Cobetia sp.]|uniref:hypothetical protein n=1 Tax=Cobetia sp. TaxID=1873876 RepID=UPI003242A6D2